MTLGELSKDVKKKHEQMYYPTCMVSSQEAIGSGVAIYSQEHEGEIYTYILTNHHVVSDSITVEKKWDPSLKKEEKQEITKTVGVRFFSYNNHSRPVGSDGYEADILAYSHMDVRDIALLRLRDTEKKIKNVAKLYPYENRKDIYMFDRCYAVGCGRGNPVFQTPGEVTNAYYELDGQGYIGTNAMITFGNSGGGLFKEDGGDYYLIGLPARVQLQSWAALENHIGFAVPIAKIYEMLEENCFRHVWSESHDPVSDGKERKEKIEKAKQEKD